LIDSGFTLLKAIEEAKKRGAKKVFAFSSHGKLNYL
jgi:phosphoribosylpyrophosphate synthetase